MQLEEVVKFLVCRSCGSKSLALDMVGVLCKQCLFRYKRIGQKVFVDNPEDMASERLPKSLKDDTHDKNALRSETRKYIKSILKNIDFDLVLDVGTGRGHYISEFGLDKEVLTLDYSPYEDVLVVANIEKGLPLFENSFDVVMLSHTLEHIFRTEDLLHDCYRVLRSGGFLVGAVPFLTKVHQAPYDFYRFTSFALTRFFEEAGFTEIQVTPLNSVFETISLHLNSSYKFLLKDLSITQKVVFKALMKSWQTTFRNLRRGETRTDFTLGYGFHCRKA